MENESSLLTNKQKKKQKKKKNNNKTKTYCPFGKKSHLADTTQDEQAWNRFIAAIEQWKG